MKRDWMRTVIEALEAEDDVNEPHPLAETAGRWIFWTAVAALAVMLAIEVANG